MEPTFGYEPSFPRAQIGAESVASFRALNAQSPSSGQAYQAVTAPSPQPPFRTRLPPRG